MTKPQFDFNEALEKLQSGFAAALPGIDQKILGLFALGTSARDISFYSLNAMRYFVACRTS